MADNFYGLPSFAGATEYLAMQEGGSAPSAATFSPATTWTPASGSAVAAVGESSEMNSQGTKGVASFDATAKPLTPNNTTGNAFRTPTAKTGTYPAGNWSISLASIAQNAGFNGTFRYRMRVFADDDTGGGSPRELTTSTLLTTVSVANLTLAASQALTVTWSAPEIVLSNENLFFAIALEVRAAGTTVSGGRDVVLYRGAGTAITTTDFVPALTESVGFLPLD